MAVTPRSTPPPPLAAPQFRLENPHVIKPQAQLFVGIFPKGPSGVELTSAYTQRESEAAKIDLGNALINFARLVPQGVLVFFPSYAALKASIVAWEQPASGGAPSILDRIRRHKRVVVEPRDGLELKASPMYLPYISLVSPLYLRATRRARAQGDDRPKPTPTLPLPHTPKPTPTPPAQAGDVRELHGRYR